MSRELKFKALFFDPQSDKLSQQWHYLEVDEEMDLLLKSCLKRKTDWLQYTGEKDRNGKEIYEGDIIKAVVIDDDGPFDAIWWISFEDYSFVCKDPEDAQCTDYLDQLDGISEFEIIGNIYENPELINQ